MVLHRLMIESTARRRISPNGAGSERGLTALSGILTPCRVGSEIDVAG